MIVCRDGCAESGLRYDFYGVGEFRLFQSSNIEVQVRHKVLGSASGNTAFEMVFRDSGVRVGMYPRPEGTVIRVFNSQAAFLSGSGQTRYARMVGDVLVDCTYGQACRIFSTALNFELRASVFSTTYLNIHVSVVPSSVNSTTGLCGSYNGNVTDDQNSIDFDRIPREDSIMWYDPPNTWETYNTPPDGYTPSDECETSELEDAATTACAEAAECNMVEECVADVCATGDLNATAGVIEACQSRKKAEDRLKDRTDGDGTTTAGPTTTLGPLTTPQPPQPPVFPPRPPIVSPVSPNRGKQLHLVCVFVMGCWDLIFIFLF